ncbi:hypothetical protein AT864_02302 [Anoxybacillus sp. P3H1B]|nr:hypothetical protein AT864_02302 [Anoxybacillus sp. P3H1B]
MKRSLVHCLCLSVEFVLSFEFCLDGTAFRSTNQFVKQLAILLSRERVNRYLCQLEIFCICSVLCSVCISTISMFNRVCFSFLHFLLCLFADRKSTCFDDKRMVFFYEKRSFAECKGSHVHELFFGGLGLAWLLRISREYG